MTQAEDSYRGKDKDPLSLNLYTYCHNNPIDFSDPSGHIRGSVVDYLNNVGIDSSFSNRANLAVEYGIVSNASQYQGSAQQNTSLLDVLKADYGDEFDNDYNDEFDEEYDKVANDPFRGRHAKQREKKQIGDAFGKRGSKEREQKSQELHKGKKGGRNDDNKSWDDLKKGNYWVQPQPQPGPAPATPTPNPSSSTITSSNTARNVGIAAGGATVGTILYWIVSEGSRFFLPRNAIPIP